VLLLVFPTAVAKFDYFYFKFKYFLLIFLIFVDFLKSKPFAGDTIDPTETEIMSVTRNGIPLLEEPPGLEESTTSRMETLSRRCWPFKY
jgi:hypothetical protein